MKYNFTPDKITVLHDNLSNTQAVNESDHIKYYAGFNIYLKFIF